MISNVAQFIPASNGHLHYRQFSDLGEKQKIHVKNLLKLDKIQKFVTKCCKIRKNCCAKFANFAYILYYVRKWTICMLDPVEAVDVGLSKYP